MKRFPLAGSIPLVMLATVVAGCAGTDGAAGAHDDAWVGTISTEGDVTTVINESGSVWGTTATLVDEASIGVDVGEDPYMLGRVRAIAASNDRIYVVDAQVPALRVYDWNGAWLDDVGGEGQGPGEFRGPTGVGIDVAGRIWLHEQSMTRLLVYSPEGEPLATRNVGGTRISGPSSSLTVTPDGHAYFPEMIRPERPATSDERRLVMRSQDLDGNEGEPIEIPRSDSNQFLEARSENAVRFTNVPFLPVGITDFSPDRAVLSGTPDAYRFEVRHADGTHTVIERRWQPVAVVPEEAEAYRRAVTGYFRDMDPTWTWYGPEIPATKPAFTDFIPTASGEIWVVRPGPGTPVPNCDESTFDPSSDPPCWDEERIVDVFGADGRFLGELDVPAGLTMRPRPFIRGSDVIARVENDEGTIMVKRYRLAR